MNNFSNKGLGDSLSSKPFIKPDYNSRKFIFPLLECKANEPVAAYDLSKRSFFPYVHVVKGEITNAQSNEIRAFIERYRR